MTVRFLTDENLNQDIVRELLQELPDLDVLRVRDEGLAGADDPAISDWCAQDSRILLTHDAKTMPRFAYERLRRAEPVPGVVVIIRRIPVGRAAELLLITLGASLQGE